MSKTLIWIIAAVIFIILVIIVWNKQSKKEKEKGKISLSQFTGVVAQNSTEIPSKR